MSNLTKSEPSSFISGLVYCFLAAIAVTWLLGMIILGVAVTRYISLPCVETIHFDNSVSSGSYCAQRASRLNVDNKNSAK